MVPKVDKLAPVKAGVSPLAFANRHHATKFTEDRKALAIELAAQGTTNTVIARALGVHEDTFQEWVRRGRDPDYPAAAEEYQEWYLELERVRAELAAEMSKVVVDTAKSGLPQTWQAAMTFLERRYPSEWSRREERVHEGRGAQALPQINILVMNDPNARAAHRDLLRSVAGAGSGESVGPSVGGELEAGRDGPPVLDVE